MSSDRYVLKKIKWNFKGWDEVRKSPEMVSLLRTEAAKKVSHAPDGYDYDVKIHQKRAAAYIWPETSEARRDNLKNNTLLKL